MKVHRIRCNKEVIIMKFIDFIKSLFDISPTITFEEWETIIDALLRGEDVFDGE